MFERLTPACQQIGSFTPPNTIFFSFFLCFKKKKVRWILDEQKNRSEAELGEEK
jgi:hypothetical protein